MNPPYKTVFPKIISEVESNIFPKVVVLTFTVLGFISFITSIIVFTFDKLKIKSLAGEIEWSSTIFITSIIFGIVLIVSILLLLVIGPYPLIVRNVMKQTDLLYNKKFKDIDDELKKIYENYKEMVKKI